MTEFPRAVRAALDQCLEGVSRRDLAARAAEISQRYRAGGTSADTIRDAIDALAYAVTRMPATYAATTSVLRKVATHAPQFAPQSLLDLGAGPGTASLAALDTWPDIARVRQLETNPHWRALSAQLMSSTLAGDALEINSDDLKSSALAQPRADLVVAAYVLVELPDAAVGPLVLRALESCSGAMVLVEPGTPAGFARIRLARTALVAAGARIIGPCPGSMTCPMIGEDWCHFSVRLARSRDHRLVKGGALPFEDEKYSWLAGTRDLTLRPASARILREPEDGRGRVALNLCTPAGQRQHVVGRRDKAAYKVARKRGWGDELDV